MKSLRRILAWSLFLGFLWAVGWPVFVYVRNTPRCVIEGPYQVAHLSADGSRLATLQFESGVGTRAPFQVWDTRTGRCIRQLWSDERVWLREANLNSAVHKPPQDDGRRAVAWLERQWVWIVDWKTGEERCLARHASAHAWAFSPKGKWLFLDVKAEKPCVVYDIATGIIKQSFAEGFKAFTPDDRRVILTARRGDGPIRVADLETGKIQELPTEAWDFAVTPDGRLLVAWMDARPGNSQGESPIDPRGCEPGLFVWDLDTFRIRYGLDCDTHANRTVAFSADSRLMASWSSLDPELKIVELETGRRTCVKVAASPTLRGEFSEDGSMFWLEHSGGVTMVNTATGQVLWDRPGRSAGFAAPSGFVISRASGAVLEFIDERGGVLRATTPPDFLSGSRLLPFRVETHQTNWTPNRRHLVISGSLDNDRRRFWEDWLQKRWPKLFGESSQVSLVMQADAGRELFRIRHGSAERTWLSDDASTLVLTEFPGNRDVIRIWDVSPTKAYLWAIGAAAGTGIALLHLNRLRRKLGARQASTQSPPLPSTPA